MPIEKLDGSWLHAQRLPLGCGWSGECRAPGHEGERPSEEELREFCNLGYAGACGRMPQERAWDSVRFGVRMNGARVEVRYVCERDHLPAEHGWLEFDTALEQWRVGHEDACLQRMAECFVAGYLERKRSAVA